MKKFFFLFILCIGLLGAFAFKDVKTEVINTKSDLITAKGMVNPAWGKMPLYFVENQGQMDEKVDYYIKGRNKTIYFTQKGLTYVLNKKKKKEKPFSDKIPQKEKRIKTGESNRRWVVKLDFVGARKDVTPKGLEKTEAIISYFKGKPEEWKTGLSTYSRIIYKDLWPGIDLVYYGIMDKMKYEFIVHPGADPTQIRLAYSGVSSVEVNSQGRLEVKTPIGGFEDEEAVGYQKINGKRVNVDMTYILEQNEAEKSSDQKKYVYGFEVGDYDRSVALILDPAILIYCGYIGGSSNEFGYGIAVDSSGNAYVIGYTDSDETTFPETGGPDLTYNGSNDVFIAKVNSSGTALVYCGYIGGSQYEEGSGIAVDSSGNAYVAGYTESTETTFPVTGGPDLTHNGGFADAFVAKVNSTGTALLYCGYIGGSAHDEGKGIAVDSSGNAYVFGFTSSDETTFPETGGPDLTYNGNNSDTFVAKVNSSGTSLVYCGYIGGSSDEFGQGIAVDSSGNAYVIGYTYSDETTFPETGGPDLTYNGNLDAFVAKVNSTGTSLVYCGYIGGSSKEYGRGIAVDSSGNAYVAGYTESTETTFPETGGPDLTYNGNEDAFVAKVNSTGTSLVYCGYIGGSSDDVGSGIAVDSSGNAYVIGITDSDETTFPEIGGPDLTYNGGYDAFVAKVNSTGTALVYCGYIGGSEYDYGYGVALDGSGNAYVIGRVGSDETTENFPVLGGPDLTHNGGYDAFVAKITESSIFIISPNGGESWQVGSLQNITWTTTGIISHVRIEYSTNNGSTWTTEIASTPNDGSYSWTIPNSPSIQCLVRISNVLGGIPSDTSDGVFSIECEDTVFKYPGVVASDVDGDGTDELLGDFGSHGLWIFYGRTWTKLSAGNPDWIVGFKHNGTEYLMCDFGSAGLWYWNFNGALPGQFVKVTVANPEKGFIVDDDGDGDDEFLLSFGANGLWRYDMGAVTKLTKLHATSPVMEDSLRGDLFTTGHEEGTLDFGAEGLWTVWHSGGSPVWLKIHASSPDDDNVSAECGIGTATEELIIDFGSTGLWLYDGSSWHQLSTDNPIAVRAVRFGTYLDYEILVTFKPSVTPGLWVWNYTGYPGTLARLNPTTPDHEGGFCEPYDPNGNSEGIDDQEVAVDFGADGLWEYDSTNGTWTKLNSDNPEFMVSCDYWGDGYNTALVVDFGPYYGLWIWDGRYPGWKRLSNYSPDGAN